MALSEDLTGKRFGSLVALNRVANRKTKVVWLLQCDCGNQTEVTSGQLKRKDKRRTISCGCQNHRKGKASHNWKSHNDIPLTYLTSVKANATSRGRECDLTLDDLQKIWDFQEHKCALTGESLILGENASLDRIDSSAGYTVDNIQWLHKDINQIKSNHDQQYFIEMCRRVANYARP